MDVCAAVLLASFRSTPKGPWIIVDCNPPDKDRTRVGPRVVFDGKPVSTGAICD